MQYLLAVSGDALPSNYDPTKWHRQSSYAMYAGFISHRLHRSSISPHIMKSFSCYFKYLPLSVPLTLWFSFHVFEWKLMISSSFYRDSLSFSFLAQFSTCYYLIVGIIVLCSLSVLCSVHYILVYGPVLPVFEVIQTELAWFWKWSFNQKINFNNVT